MTDRLGMKKKLDNAGLLFMWLATAAFVVGFVVITFISGFSIYLFTPVVLAVLFTLFTLKDRLVGGLLTTVISALILVPLSIWLSTPEVAPPNYILFSVFICFLLGGVCILTSIAIRSPTLSK
jgi:uncharacterized membrane protein YagU involved in acid resistance